MENQEIAMNKEMFKIYIKDLFKFIKEGSPKEMDIGEDMINISQESNSMQIQLEFDYKDNMIFLKRMYNQYVRKNRCFF